MMRLKPRVRLRSRRTTTKDVTNVDNGIGSLVLLALLMFVFYFMLIRPQKRRVEQHRKLVESVSVGDQVVTIGGMYGTVRSLDDDEMELEIASGTTVRMVRSAISRTITDDGTDVAESPVGESA